MPQITDITYQTKNKSRCNLFVDGEFFSGVSLETVLKFRLKVGDQVETENLTEILIQNERSEALNKAVAYISKYLKTKREVKDYLIRKGYSEEIAWYCVDKLKEYDYVNDTEYSKRYVESVSKNQGRRLVEYKLMMKGVKKQDIATAYDESTVDAKENAKALAIKYLKNKENTKENKAKAYRYLIGRGFTHEEAGYALSNYGEGD